MDQVYRIGRRLGKLMLALLMVISLFDLTSLFANDETNAPAKVIQLCDEENIQSTEDGELLIPWSSTIETTDENMLLYNDYENTMQDNLYATPDTLNLQIVDHTGGKQIELVEGTDYELYYTNPSDGLFTMNKEDAAQFTHFKIMFTDKTKTFSNMMIKYNTHAKIADVKENEQERKFLNEATFKIETNYWITETATYTYTNPNFKPVENSMNAQENVNAIYAPREFTWEDDTVKIKASVTQRDIPDNVVMKAERVTESADKENNIITEILDQITGKKYYYQVTFTSNDEVIAIDQSKIKFESSVKPSVKAKLQYRSARSTNPGKEPDKSVGTYPSRYKVWPYGGGCEEKHENSDEGNKYQYGEFGEDTNYDIFNILANYNVFTFGDYYGTHVVGPVAVKGEAHKQGGTGEKLSIGGTTTDAIYHHTVPSIIEGYANITSTVITCSNVPVFFGDISENKLSEYGGSKNWSLASSVDENGQMLPEGLYNNYYFANDYLDFGKAQQEIQSQMRSMENFNGTDVTGREITKVAITDKEFNEIKDKAVGTVVDKESYKLERAQEGYGLRLKLGYNFVISSIKDFDYIVYDYDDFDEATTKTTFINILDSGTVTMPGMYKSKIDDLGDKEGITNVGNVTPAYQFDSIEVEKAFNIVCFFQNASDIQVGFKTVEGHEEINSNKFVGHLVAPYANVDNRSGDYNGSMIAAEIHTTAEGHMWPFKIGASIDFNKSVNGSKPKEGEVFKFKLENISGPLENKLPIQYAESDSNGNVSFPLKGLDTVATGNNPYIFKITEENAGENYKPNTQVFYAKVSVESSESQIGGNKMIVRFEGFFKDQNANEKIELKDGESLFNNERLIIIEKKWLDEKGETLNDPDYDKVSFDLIRVETENIGCNITYNVYRKQNDNKVYDKTPIATKNVFVPLNDEYVVDIDAPASWSKYEKITSSARELVSVSKTKGENLKVSIKGQTQDMIVNIYYREEAKVGDNEYDIKLSDTSILEPKVNETRLSSYEISKANGWKISIPDLPAYDENRSFRYTYKVEEKAIKGYITSYSENNEDGIIAGTITITNKLLPIDLIVQKESSTGNNQHLAGAHFKLYTSDSVGQNELGFVKNDKNEYMFVENGTIKEMVTAGSGENIGKFNILDLPYGNYVLTETQSPEGFVIDNKNIYIHIDRKQNKSYYQLLGNDTAPNDTMEKMSLELLENTDTAKFEYQFGVKNTPTIDVPEAGGTPDNRYQKIGFLLACTGLAMYAIYEVKRKKNKEKSEVK